MPGWAGNSPWPQLECHFWKVCWLWWVETWITVAFYMRAICMYIGHLSLRKKQQNSGSFTSIFPSSVNPRNAPLGKWALGHSRRGFWRNEQCFLNDGVVLWKHSDVIQYSSSKERDCSFGISARLEWCHSLGSPKAAIQNSIFKCPLKCHEAITTCIVSTLSFPSACTNTSKGRQTELPDIGKKINRDPIQQINIIWNIDILKRD